jgi:hypothetical protein
LAVLPWKKPPVSGIAVAVAHVSAKGTSVGGTAGRTNAVSSTGLPSTDSTTARYDPAGTPRAEARTGELLPLPQSLLEAAPEHAGSASETAPVSPCAMRSTSSTSEVDARSSVYAASTEAIDAQPTSMSSVWPVREMPNVSFGTSAGAPLQVSSGGGGTGGAALTSTCTSVGPSAETAT